MNRFTAMVASLTSSVVFSQELPFDHEEPLSYFDENRIATIIGSHLQFHQEVCDRVTSWRWLDEYTVTDPAFGHRPVVRVLEADCVDEDRSLTKPYWMYLRIDSYSRTGGWEWKIAVGELDTEISAFLRMLPHMDYARLVDSWERAQRPRGQGESVELPSRSL